MFACHQPGQHQLAAAGSAGWHGGLRFSSSSDGLRCRRGSTCHVAVEFCSFFFVFCWAPPRNMELFLGFDGRLLGLLRFALEC